MADIAVLGIKLDANGAIVSARQFSRELNTLGLQGDTTAAQIGGLSAKLIGVGTAAAGMLKAVHDAQQFESSMALVATVADTTKVSIETLGNATLEMSRNLPVKSVNDLTAGLYDVISAGIPAGDAIAYLDTAARSAVAGVTSTKVAVDALTTATNAWRGENLTAAQASDQMFMAVNKGKMTFEQLASSIGTIAPVAAAYKISMSDVLGASAQLTLSGLTASEAMIGIRSAITNIINPTEKLKQQFPQLAKEFNATKLEAVGFTNFLLEFNQATGGSKEALNALFSDVQGKTAVFSLLADSGKAAAEQMRNIENAAGATDAAFNKATATSAALNQILRNELSAAFIELGTNLLPTFNVALQALSSILGPLSRNIDSVVQAAELLAAAWAVGKINAYITGLVAARTALLANAAAHVTTTAQVVASELAEREALIFKQQALATDIAAGTASKGAKTQLILTNEALAISEVNLATATAGSAAALTAQTTAIAAGTGAMNIMTPAAARLSAALSANAVGIAVLALFGMYKVIQSNTKSLDDFSDRQTAAAASAAEYAKAISGASKELLDLEEAEERALGAMQAREAGRKGKVFQQAVNAQATAFSEADGSHGVAMVERQKAEKEYHDALLEAEKTNARINTIVAQRASITKTGNSQQLTGNAEAEKAARAIKQQNDDRVRLAQQALDLSRMDSEAAAKQVVANKAINEEIKARRDHEEAIREGKGYDIAPVLAAIRVEKDLTTTIAEESAAVTHARASLERWVEQKQREQENARVGIRLTKEANESIKAYGEIVRNTPSTVHIKPEELVDLERQIEILEATGGEVKKLSREYAVYQAMKSGMNQKDAEEFVRLQEHMRRLTADTVTWGDTLLDVSNSFADMADSMRDGSRNMVLAINDVVGALNNFLKAQQEAAKSGKSTEGFGGGMLQTSASIAAGALSAGYGVGQRMPNRLSGAVVGGITGALGGAAMGAQIGSAGGPIGAIGGAIIGAVAGIVGGFAGANHKMKGVQQEMAVSQKQLDKSFEMIRLSFSDDKLGVAIANAKTQFDDLRKSTLAAYAGGKNEAQRAVKLAEIDVLEKQRIAILQKEAQVLSENFAKSNDALAASVAGRDVEAQAILTQIRISEQVAAAIKEFGDVAEVARYKALLLADAEKKATEAKAAEEERVKRSRFGMDNTALAFTDPRKASELALAEGQRQRLADATTELEKLSAAALNLAESAAFAAKRLEEDTRESERNASRVLGAFGNSRNTEDFTRLASQRQERIDLQNSGASDFNKEFNAYAQRAENWAIESARRVEDQTKVLTDAANAQRAANDLQKQKVQQDAQRDLAAEDRRLQDGKDLYNIVAEKADAQIKVIRDQTDVMSLAFDRSIASAQQQVQYAQQQAQALEESRTDTARAFEQLSTFSRGFNLSDLSSLSTGDKTAEARRQFTDAAERARAGDKDAAGMVPELAQKLLELSRTENASGAAYGADEKLVREIAGALTTQYGAQLDRDTAARDNAVRALEVQQSIVTNLQELKQAMLDSAAADISIEESKKDVAAKQLDALEKLVDARKSDISKDAETTVAALDKLNEDIALALKDQVAILELLEQTALEAKLKADPFYERFIEFLSRVDGTPGGDDADPVRVIIDSSEPTPAEKAAQQSRTDLIERQDRTIARLEAQIANQQQTYTMLEDRLANLANALQEQTQRLGTKLDTVSAAVR